MSRIEATLHATTKMNLTELARGCVRVLLDHLKETTATLHATGDMNVTLAQRHHLPESALATSDGVDLDGTGQRRRALAKSPRRFIAVSSWPANTSVRHELPR